MKMLLGALLLLGGAQESKEDVVLRTTEDPGAVSFPPLELHGGEIGIVVGGLYAGGFSSVWPDLLSAARWTVVNLGAPDIPSWRSGVGNLPVVSSNVRGVEKGTLIREAGGRKIAFIGVTALPDGLASSDVADPKAAVAKALKEARADLFVLVARMSRDQAAELLRGTAGIDLCVVSGRGGGDPEPLRIGSAWMVQSPSRGEVWGRVGIRLDGQGRIAAVTNRFTAPEGKPSEAVAAAKKNHGVPIDPVRRLRESVKEGPPGGAAAGLPQAATRAFRLTIHSVTERSSYGTWNPGPGRRALVLDAEFENTIPLTLVQSHQVPTQYRIEDVGNHLYLVANGHRLLRLSTDASNLPGHLAVKAFALDRLGARARGNLVFETPAEAIQSLELRFYDFAHGHMTLKLRPGEPRGEERPLAPAAANEVIQAAVFGLRRIRESAGAKAPEGMTFASVDLRARSAMTLEADATAFDPKAKPKQKLQVGGVADWQELRKHLHLVLDGEYAYGPVDGTELPDAPRFLPDVLTGGAAVFLIPEKAASVELRCDFPNASLPSGQVIHPRAITFALEGKRPAVPARGAIVEIDDDVFKVAIAGQGASREFAGMKAGEGKSFLVLDVTVSNSGPGGEFFQTKDQLKYATEKGQMIGLHEATFRGPRYPSPLVWIPAAERRSFQAVFEIPDSDRKPRLAYSGVSKAATVNLKAIDAPAPQATKRLCPKCKHEAGPQDKFCENCGTKIEK